MSWLQDLAGKAENMLNKLDQNAASVLHYPEKLSVVEEDQPLTLIKIENESKILKRGVKSLQLTPKKSSSSSSLSEMTKSKFSDDLNDDERKSVSSRRSSTSGSVIKKVTEAAMQTSFESQNVESPIQLRLVELEDICNSLVGEKDFLRERNETLEDVNSKNIKIISELEANVSKLMRNELELTEKLDWSKKETDQAVQEMQQYRVRAQQTLQMKEKIIEQLKQGQLNETEDNTFTALTLEVQQLKTEKRNLTEEIHKLTEKLEQNKDIQQQFERKLELLPEKDFKIKELQEQIIKISTNLKEIDAELKQKSQECFSLREEMMKLKSNLNSRITEKETEILDLRSKLSSQKRQTINSGGAEERIHSLTHSLVQKQAALESITGERNALRLQLEKLDSLHRATVMENRGHRPLRIDVNETDDVKARIPNFLQENPFDTRFSRRVKRAYSTLDSVGVRIGSFLRRFPLARIMVLFYIAILHFWVMIVLFTSTPN